VEIYQAKSAEQNKNNFCRKSMLKNARDRIKGFKNKRITGYSAAKVNVEVCL